MSDVKQSRRTAAAAALATDAPTVQRAAPLKDARRRAATANRRRAAAENLPAAAADQRAAGLAPTWRDAAALELADGIKAGAILARRNRAAEIVATNTALGYTAERFFLMPEDTDPETGEPLDARDVLADVRPGTAHRYAAEHPVMRGDDLLRIAAADAHRAARMTSGALDADDVRQEVALQLLDRFTGRKATHPAPRPYIAGHFPLPLQLAADAAAADRAMRYARPVEPLPRWDAIDRADLDADADRSSRRRMWRAYAARIAFGVARDDQRLTVLNRPADWTDAGDTAPTPEQVAAAAAERAAAHIAQRAETVDQDTLNAYVHTAPGGSLKSAERDAVLMALAGVTRDQLAAARGVDAGAVKKGAQRGRKSLAARIDSPRTLREWMRAGRAAAADPLDGWAQARADLVRLAAPAADTPDAVHLRWPDRMADDVTGEPCYPASVTAEHPARGIAAASPLPIHYAAMWDGETPIRCGATCNLPNAAQRAALDFLKALERLAPIPAAPLRGTPVQRAPRGVESQPWVAASNAAVHRRAAAAADAAERDTRTRYAGQRNLSGHIARARLSAMERANAPTSPTLAAFIHKMTTR